MTDGEGNAKYIIDRLDGERWEIMDRLDANCELLAVGYPEQVEYKLPVKYHQKGVCEAERGGAKCSCPVIQEDRTRMTKRPGLLAQLKDFKKNQDTDRNPKAERGAPRVKTAGKPPGDMSGFLTLDEITCDAYMTLDRVFEQGGRSRTWLSEPIVSVFLGLTYQVAQFVEERPDLARETLTATNKWVRQAKTALRITVSDAMLNAACDNCGGGLIVSWDNSSDVRCVGSLSAPSCGETYPMSEWMSLYTKGKRC